VSSYVKDFQQLIGAYNASRSIKGKGQKIIHNIDPDSGSSSDESLCNSISDDEDENVCSVSYGDKNVGKNRTGMVLVKRIENTENELDVHPEVDDFDGSLLVINFMLLLSFECTLNIINDLREKSAFDSFLLLFLCFD
jgi:werner syndrome ATP-dependent helicase